MEKTAIKGLSVHSTRQAQVEFVSDKSQLVGDKIDSITLRLKKFGTPTGTALIGIFNSDLTVKKLFGTIDASTISATYTDYTFSLPDSSQPYEIQRGDRIGIKFAGGNLQNNIGVMTDNNPADPFDGQNSYHKFYTTKWSSFLNNDMYMILQEKTPSTPPSYPTIHMEDVTSSFGLSTFAGRQINAEFVSETSQLVGDSVDAITLKLRKFGTPTGIAEIGIFNSDLSVKKLFGTVDVSTLTTIYNDYTFSLPANQGYNIVSGDRIGIKFTGGTISNNLSVMTDQDPAEPFDGTNSYLTSYTTSWSNTPQNKDLTMTLREIDPAPATVYPILHMEDTTASIGLSTFSKRPIQAELVTDSSALVGDKIDSITLKLRKFGAPTGNAQVGVFNSDLSVKKLFGTITVSTLGAAYTNYSFKLDDEFYTIQSGDRIGIKFTGGDISNNLSVMIDQADADPFDGANTYHTYYDTTWKSFVTRDLTMTLSQIYP